MFGYLKKFKHRKLAIDLRPLFIDEALDIDERLYPDFLEDYLDAEEELPRKMPDPRGPELQTNIFFDADHGHNKKTHRSITGIIIAVGRTPVE